MSITKSKPWYQRGDKPTNEKLLPACRCNGCRRQRVKRLVAGACVYLELYRGELNRLQSRPRHVPSWRIKSEPPSHIREALAAYGG
jgi:hypothetical protein